MDASKQGLTDLVNKRLHVLNQTGFKESGDLGFTDMCVAFVEHGGENVQLLDEDWNGDFVERRHCERFEYFGDLRKAN